MTDDSPAPIKQINKYKAINELFIILIPGWSCSPQGRQVSTRVTGWGCSPWPGSSMTGPCTPASRRRGKRSTSFTWGAETKGFGWLGHLLENLMEDWHTGKWFWIFIKGYKINLAMNLEHSLQIITKGRKKIGPG